MGLFGYLVLDVARSVRRARMILRFFLRLSDDDYHRRFSRKLSQWDGSSWALREIKEGYLASVEFVLNNSVYGSDEYGADFLLGARETLVSMSMLPKNAEVLRSYWATDEGQRNFLNSMQRLL